MMQNSKYTVLMSVYYKEKPEYLSLSIESMLNQTVKPDEFIIVKDGPLTTELDEVINNFVTAYFVWSVVLLPSRLILSKSSMLGVLLKWFRTVFFIGDAQLWYLNALLVGLILILILKKSKINDTWIMLIGVVFFIAGIFVQKQLDVASVNGYAGFWKLYYMIWGKTIKNSRIFCRSTQ